MKAVLLHYTPLSIAVKAIRTCWQSFNKSDGMGNKDINLVDRVANKHKHSSTIEHLNYSFYLYVSRALLQELARHRHTSLSVKSTRYTLKELRNEEPFILDGLITNSKMQRAKKYIVFTGNNEVDEASIWSLDRVRHLISIGLKNDIVKYALPESYKTELTWTINARSLQNFLKLRSDKSALWEIRELAYEIFNALPNSHKYLFELFMHKT